MQTEVDIRRATVCEFETELSADELAKCVSLGVDIPPGAKKVLFNHLKCMWYELTNNPDDPLVKSGEATTTCLPGSWADQERIKRTEAPVAPGGAQLVNAMAFSSHTDDPREFEATECSYQPQRGLNPAMDGIIFDKYTVAAMKTGDSHVHCDKDGNLIAIFIMPVGWVTHQRGDGVCQMCGSFPVHARCPRCLCARFCSQNCLFRATNLTGIHSTDICTQFLEARVKNAVASLARALPHLQQAELK